MLPGLDGRGLCRRVRDHSDVPILMLTALDDDRDKLHGFDLGADDYLTKPFNPKELVARVGLSSAARPRAARPPARLVSRSAISCWILERRTLAVTGREVPLRTKEFDLLAVFAEHVGIVLAGIASWSESGRANSTVKPAPSTSISRGYAKNSLLRVHPWRSKQFVPSAIAFETNPDSVRLRACYIQLRR